MAVKNPIIDSALICREGIYRSENNNIPCNFPYVIACLILAESRFQY